MYTAPLPMSNSSARAASPQSADSNSKSSANPAADLTSTFLLLLTAQLKNQSPIDPLDPNQFVGQLAQFESLGQLTQIQQLMQTLVDNTSTTSNSNASGKASAHSNSVQNPNSSSH